MEKKKKILITVIACVLFACVVIAVILISNSLGTGGKVLGGNDAPEQSFDTLDEAVLYAGFPFQCTDRLGGFPATQYSADKTVITVTYGSSGYITKTLITTEDETESESGDETVTEPETASESSALPDGTEKEDGFQTDINGVSIWFTGDENSVTKAEWTDNGFDYAIVLSGEGVSADDMTEYVSATR